MGGFGKEPEDYPDPYHSYLALAALAIHDERDAKQGLKRLDAKWNISMETAEWLRQDISRIKQSA
jgi:geranylgeranyl transferase type-1 subunit beta